MWPKKKIGSWKRFVQEVKARQPKLLARLDQYPRAILVGGCQRSGTTMLTRIICSSEEIAFYRAKDWELMGALLLSGHAAPQHTGRHCFQTTYLNERYGEYFEHAENCQLVWMLRHPLAVVHSMLVNWRRYGLQDLYQGCGRRYARKVGYRLSASRKIAPLEKACLSYNAKVEQLVELHRYMPTGTFWAVEYDRLVREKQRTLRDIYAFLDLPCPPTAVGTITSTSLEKYKGMSNASQALIRGLCGAHYQQARRIADFYCQCRKIAVSSPGAA